MDEGRIVAWRKREGDRVRQGEILFEVETDKATMEVEAPVAGTLRRSQLDWLPKAKSLASVLTEEETVTPAAPPEEDLSLEDFDEDLEDDDELEGEEKAEEKAEAE